MNQARPTLGAEVAVRAAVGVWPAVHGDGARVRLLDLEGREDGRHPVAAGGLVAALGAVADVHGQRLGCRCGEADLAALAASFHIDESARLNETRWCCLVRDRVLG